MASTEVSTCCCNTIGAPKELRRCVEHHSYWLGDRNLTSVSKVIFTVFPTDYSLISDVVLQNAKVKGSFIDNYFSEWLTVDSMLSPEEFREMVEPYFQQDLYKTAQEHAEDARVKLCRLLDWWTASGFKAKQVQHTLFSERDGTAGTLDIGTDEDIIDVKVVSVLQPSYALQVGAYLHMDEPFPLRGGAVAHVTKDKVRLVRYDAKRIKKQWQAALTWWNTLGELKR